MRKGPVQIHAILHEDYGKPVTLCGYHPWELEWGQVWVDEKKKTLDWAKRTNPDVPVCVVCEERLKNGWHHLNTLGNIDL